ncbi:MAG: hypothetical protein ACRDOH_34170, partial [Streptosporangiaceae bacterium]
VWHANLGPLRTPQMRAVHEHLDHRIREAGTQVRSVQRDFYPERAGCHASEPPAAAPYGEPGT